MYPSLLALHSLLRWLFLAVMIFALVRAYSGWFGKKPYEKLDNSLRLGTASLAHVQLLFGIWLFLTSPLMEVFMNNFKEAMKEKELRFFGMEHNVMMILAIVLLTIGSAKAKRKTTDLEKYKTTAIWFSIALLIILVSIPWPFSPLAERPYFRGF